MAHSALTPDTGAESPPAAAFDRAALQTLLSAAPLGVAVLDIAGNFLEVNEALAAMNGVPASDHIGRHVRDVVPDLWPKTQETLERLKSGADEVIEFDITGTTPATGGRPRDWHESWHALKDDRGAIIGACAVVRDVTDLKRAEQQAWSSRERLVRLLQAMPEGVLAYDRNGVFLFANERAAQLVGLGSAEDLRGLRYEQILGGRQLFDEAGEPFDPMTSPLADVRAGVDQGSIVLRLRSSPGAEEQWLEVTSLRVPDRAGELDVVVVVVADITAQKRAERGLRESELQYRTIAESMPALVAVLAPDGKVIHVNARAREYVGVTREDLKTWSWEDVIHADDIAGNRAVIVDALSRGESVESEFRLRRADGQYRWHVWHANPVRNARGDLRMWIGVAVDVQEEKQAQDAVRQREEMYRGLAESMPALVCVIGPGGQVSYANARWQQFVGLTGQEIRNRGWTSAIHPEDMDRITSLWSSALASGHPFEQQFRLRRSNGEYRWHQLRAIPVRAPAGIVSWVGVAIDVDEQNRAIETLQFLADTAPLLSATMRSFDRTLESVVALCIPTMADFVDLYIPVGDGTLTRVRGGHPRRPVFVSDSLAEYEAPVAVQTCLRTPRSTLYPRIARRSIAYNIAGPEDGQALLDAGLRSAMVVPMALRGDHCAVLVLAAADRTYLAADAKLAELLAPRFALAIDNARLYHDATETQAMLQAALESRDEFLGLMSHELRTPTTTIYGGAKILRARHAFLSEEDHFQLLADIENESERLFHMIEDLLSLARLQHGVLAPVEPVLLQRLVHQTVDAFRYARPVRKVITYAEEDLAAAAGEPTYVEQVVRNLLSNADKYSPERELIEVRVYGEGEEAIVSILDRGPGVSPDDLERIFDRFYRAESTSRSVQGLGLGLTLCKRLVDAQRGRIWAELRDGGGLAVSFALPVCPDC